MWWIRGCRGVVALILSKTSPQGSALPWPNIIAFGVDAVTVPGAAAVVEPGPVSGHESSSRHTNTREPRHDHRGGPDHRAGGPGRSAAERPGPGRGPITTTTRAAATGAVGGPRRHRRHRRLDGADGLGRRAHRGLLPVREYPILPCWPAHPAWSRNWPRSGGPGWSTPTPTPGLAGDGSLTPGTTSGSGRA